MKDFDPKKIYTFDREKKAFLVDSPLADYRDLYNEWDYSPVRHRDIDDDLYQYLVECSEEIPVKYGMIINFFLPEKVRDQDKERRSLSGFRNFFAYRVHRALQKRRKLLIQTLLYAVFGSLFLAVPYMLRRFLPEDEFRSLLQEGLFIGGWVLFWEAFSVVFFQLAVINRSIRTLARLRESTVNFNYLTEEELEKRQ